MFGFAGFECSSDIEKSPLCRHYKLLVICSVYFKGIISVLFFYIVCKWLYMANNISYRIRDPFRLFRKLLALLTVNPAKAF